MTIKNNSSDFIYLFSDCNAPEKVMPSFAESAYTPNEVAFIFDDVNDWEALADDMPVGVNVVILDAKKDGLLQIADYVSSLRTDSMDAIHLISHGASGTLRLGTAVLDSSNLDEYATTLNKIASVLTADGDLMLYGCQVAGGFYGFDFIEKLSKIASVDIAASENLTGAKLLGGDWTLEKSVGNIQSHTLAFSDYASTLTINSPPVLDLNGSATSGTDYSVTLADAANGLVASVAEASDAELDLSHWGGGSLSVQRIKSGGSADGSIHDVFSFTTGSTLYSGRYDCSRQRQ